MVNLIILEAKERLNVTTVYVAHESGWIVDSGWTMWYKIGNKVWVEWLPTISK
jgi:hypothetical protein